MHVEGSTKVRLTNGQILKFYFSFLLTLMENAILKLGFEHIISFVTMQIIVLYLFYLYRPFFLITFRL